MTMAIWRPLFCSVKGPKRRAASAERLKLICHCPGISGLRFSIALRKSRPLTTGVRLITYQFSAAGELVVEALLLPCTISVPGGKTPPCEDIAATCEG